MGIQSLYLWTTSAHLRNRQCTSLNGYKPQLTGKTQREVLGSIKHHMHMDHRLNRTLHHYFEGHRESEGALKFVTFFLLIFVFVCLSSLSSTKSVSPITFPNRSSYYSRNCQGKQTTKLACLFSNCEATEMVLMKAWSDHVFLVNLLIFPQG